MQAEYLVGREAELDLATEILTQEGAGAVLLIADPGIGKTAMAAELASRLSGEMVVMHVHGSPALSAVPFGVLAPYLLDLPVDQATSPVAILREFWSQFEKRRGSEGNRLLLVVDDAHDLDEGSTQILAELVTAGWARLVATSRPRPGLPPALLQLWYDGLAERLELHPLEQETVTELAEKMLGGTVMASTADVLHTVSEGNPLLLRSLVEDAKADGNLVRRNGVWFLTRALTGSGEGLAEVVRNKVLRTSEAEREAMFVVALSEPVPAAVLDSLVGRETVRSLMDNRLVLSTNGIGSPLKMWHPMYGEALRQIVSPARSLQIRQRMVHHLAAEPATAEGLLRMVSWALDCGADVEDEQLLQAAFLAAKLLQNQLAMAAAAKVRSEVLRPRARVVMAMVSYNDGDYRAAVRLLEEDSGFLDADPSGPLGAGLLWAAARSALGDSSADIAADARAAAEGLAARHSADPAKVAEISRHADALELAALAHSGLYAELREGLEKFEAGMAADEPDFVMNQLFLLAMTCELLMVEGQAVQALDKGRDALVLLDEHKDDLLYFSDFIVVRYALAALEAGEWPAAESALDRYAASSAMGLIIFGGDIQTLQGLSLLRQGRLEQAAAVLTPAVEALKVRDPQRLRRLGVAVAFYAAARTGDKDLARRLAGEVDTAAAGGAYIEALAELFVLAAKEHLDRGTGLEKLRELPESSALHRLPGVLLQNVVLRAELGDLPAMEVIRDTASPMGGSWANGWESLAVAQLGGAGDGFVNAGNLLAAAGMPGPAAVAFDKAANAFDAEGKRPEARQAAVLRDASEANLGSALVHDPHTETDRSVPLTRREQDIVALAVSGLTDRQIAEKLMVSVRTVEGHLYRSYAKLGIRRREDLGAAVRS
ncbi:MULTISPECIES: AAA family ATPase [Paenarthrobacter]|uniref:AAA family ATPase n=1 Tax=Paenarthrobacter ureafaciens TaxID=37931 RepID=A0AAX3EPD0_PAEUR|nr:MULTISPECIES: LuxR family transcriptional regulator [Paenarthrobacter]NKR11016.1 LuxR family transcriptional regulator [Arthrobacter sp. M5]NKR17473.1 LuxR family transcriptional regulator [Arthrobacter sp. M6]OEH64009.1 LuxR family transcriptional regulator [Arthrobacter sp. D4]OEH64679.1 LuxR family transcriptional regulator [Arthrobacter sp. D2]MDO5863917.1 AAA family ATPase [Paenarthrobacter sp. SD-2]